MPLLTESEARRWASEFLLRTRCHSEKSKTPIRPCTEEEVALLEKRYGVSLPLVYRLFLLGLGNSAAGLGDASRNLLYPQVLRGTASKRASCEELNKEMTPEYIRNVNRRRRKIGAELVPLEAGYHLPNDALIIYDDDCLYYWMIRCGEHQVDPPVYLFDDEGWVFEFQLVCNCLSDFLELLLLEAKGTV